MLALLLGSSPCSFLNLRLTGEGDLDSLWTGSVLAEPRLKLLLEYLLLPESLLLWGLHWVPDMKVCTITS